MSDPNVADSDAAARSNTLLRLWVHVLEKGWQAGSVLGTGAAGVWYLKNVVSRAHTPASSYIKPLSYGGLGGFALVGVLGYFKISQLDEDGVADRSYRLYYNQGQNRVDRFARVGAAAGLLLSGPVLSYLRVQPATPLQRLGAAAGATTLSVLAHVLTSSQRGDKGPNKMLHELKNQE